jgi:hypothetical protein
MKCEHSPIRRAGHRQQHDCKVSIAPHDTAAELPRQVSVAFFLCSIVQFSEP